MVCTEILFVLFNYKGQKRRSILFSDSRRTEELLYQCAPTLTGVVATEFFPLLKIRRYRVWSVLQICSGRRFCAMAPINKNNT